MKIINKKVIVTGASSGIGRELSIALAGKGALLTLAGRSLDRLNETAKEITSRFPDYPAPRTAICDVTDRESIIRLFEQCEGGIDILINNAGISVYGDTCMTAVEDFRSVLETNFFGAVYCMLSAIPVMKRQGSGLIVNIASVAGKHGVPYLGAYGASKSALVTVSQSLRAELAKTGINIMIVYPGYTQTNIFLNEIKAGGARRPLGPYMNASRVAQTTVKAIERNKKELTFTLEGKFLPIVQGLFPWMVERSMRKIAEELRDK